MSESTRKLLRAILLALFVVIALTAIRACAQDSLPDAPSAVKRQDCGLKSPCPEWHLDHAIPAVKRHNWFYRHPVATAAIVVGIAGGIVAATRQWGCPNKIDGYPYDGTPPCPKSCEADGCYWGPGTRVRAK
jgi:hypothetical protein